MLPCHLRKPQPHSVRFTASSSGLKVFWVVGLGWIYEGVKQEHTKPRVMVQKVQEHILWPSLLSLRGWTCEGLRECL